MAGAFGRRLRELRTETQVLQSRFAEKCGISSAYLSDIERGKRNPPEDRVILLWAEHLDAGRAKEIGEDLIDLAAADRGSLRAGVEQEAVVVDPAGVPTVRRGRTEPKNKTPFLNHFCTDLVVSAREGQLDEAPERAQQFDAIASVTARMQGNSVVLTHPNGREIGRIVQGLACEIAGGRAAKHLSDKRVLALGYGKSGIMAGVKYRGQLEERADSLIRETRQAGDVLLYVPSLADLADLEANTKGSFFLPALQNGDVQVIAGATPAAMSYCKQVCPDLVDCFREVAVGGLDREGVLRGLYAVADRYAAYHGVTYTDEALNAIVGAAEDGDASGFWQRGLNLLDEVGAKAKVEEWTGEITGEDMGRTAEELSK